MLNLIKNTLRVGLYITAAVIIGLGIESQKDVRLAYAIRALPSCVYPVVFFIVVGAFLMAFWQIVTGIAKWRITSAVPYPTGHRGLYWVTGFEGKYQFGYPVAAEGTMPGDEKDCLVCREARQKDSRNTFAVHPRPAWEP